MKRQPRKLVKILLTEEEAIACILPVFSSKPGMSWKVDKMIRAKVCEVFPQIAALRDEYALAEELRRKLYNDPEYRAIERSYSDKRHPLYERERALSELENVAKSQYFNDILSKNEIHRVIAHGQVLIRTPIF